MNRSFLDRPLSSFNLEENAVNANYNGLTQPSNMTCDRRLRDDLGDD